VANARRSLRRVGGDASARLAGLVDELEIVIARTRKIADQTRTRLNGDTPDGAAWLVSLHDADACPIAKGRLGRPVEFGYKAQVVDNADGVVVGHSVMIGNSADAPQLVPAIERIARRFGSSPRAVTADRGCGHASVDADLAVFGVKTVAIRCKGKPGAARRAVEQGRGFRRLVKWRTGSQGRSAISNTAMAGTAP
jgi:IS5 family transposase